MLGRKPKNDSLVEVMKITTESDETFYCLTDFLKNFKADFKKIEKIKMRESEYNALNPNKKAWRLME